MLGVSLPTFLQPGRWKHPCQRLRMRRISYVDGRTAAVLARRGGSFEVVDEMLAGKRLSNPRR